MIKKYVSDLYEPSKVQLGRLNVIYAPMGSGKTHLFHQLLKKHKCLMVAPYKSCLDDFGLVHNYKGSNSGLDYEFLYTADLINAITKGWAGNIDITNEKAVEKAAIDYVNKMATVPYTHILFDEVDFMWLQAELTWLGNSRLQFKDAKVFEYIINALASKFYLIGQSSTVIPHLGILKYGGLVEKGAKTSVRFDSITPVLVNKDVTHDQLFKIAIDKSMDKINQLPTLVYKNIFTHFDITYMDNMVKQGKRVLVVMRKENSPKLKTPNNLTIDSVVHVGAIEAMASGITQQANHLHYKIISSGTALDKITPLPDPYMFFDYIFINTSSSRQVSLKKVRGKGSTKVRVITIGEKLNSTSHQVAGRFRENRVEIIHYLKGFTKKNIPSFSRLELWDKLLKIDLLIRLYMEHSGVAHPYSGMSGLARVMQKHKEAEWIGKSAKGQSIQKTLNRLGTFTSWLNTLSKQDLTRTQKDLFADYQNHCTKLGEKPFSKNVFPTKLKEAKANHKP